MGRHLALLVGASDYQSTQGDFSSLGFIPAELEQLRVALTARDFEVELVARGYVDDHGTGINASHIRSSINKALANARMNDTLLIVVSGHGIQHEGRDYIVPEGLHPFDDHVEESVPVDWAAGAVSRSQADTVVFLLDTCREGVREEAKGRGRLVRRAPDLDWKLERRRKVARIFACSPLEKALWAKGGAGGDAAGAAPFSLFTRALTDLVREHRPRMTLTQLLASLQTRIDELHTVCGKNGRPQQVDHQITSGPVRDEIVVLPSLPGAEEDPPTRSYADHAWVHIVTEHRAWSLVPASWTGPVAALKQRCAEITARLAAENDLHAPRLTDDPWHDPTHVERTSGQLAQLLIGAPSSERPRALTDLMPTEAALLALTPFLAHTVEVRLAATEAQVLQDDPPQFTTFIERYPRERRRLEQARRAGNAPAVAQIRWWLFHRWLLHRGESYHQSVVDPLLPPPADDLADWVPRALGSGVLLRLVNELRLSPFSLLGSGDQPEAQTGVEGAAPRVRSVVAQGDADQHDVRERLLATLLKLARARAVTPQALPQVLVQNLGVRHQVDLHELRTCLQKSYWDRVAKSITLRATTRHHVGTLAVEMYCDQVDGLLRDIGKQSDLPMDLRPLENLPARAEPELDAPQHLREAIRFRADEERVLDLLMGRNLYKNPELAVRELYQNALDACRHRELRTRYLRRMGRPLPEWEGLITFKQGVDSQGRHYLRCTDTGIGMGVNEIRHAFAEAGARFVHLPEYVREMALWQQHAEDLKLYPNSRFGIGVLSYFMLADEITVETCRLSMEGRPGQGLRVSIAGPGTLFRIDPLPDDPERDAGTTVTLYLNPPEEGEGPLSCVQVLSEHLWIAPYRTTASMGGTPVRWEADRLRGEALEQHQSGHVSPLWRHGRGKRVAAARAPGGRLYWVDGKGVYLADGVKTGDDAFGMVVDLRDDLRPELLSVDRVELQRYDEAAVRQLLVDGIPTLISSPVFSYAWALRLAGSDEKLTVECLEHAAAAGNTWDVFGHEVPVATSGLFPPDELILRAVTGRPPQDGRARPLHDHLFVSCLPEYVVRWRLLSYLRAGLGGPTTDVVAGTEPLTALPTDLTLLSRTSRDGAGVWRQRLTAWRTDNPYDTRRRGFPVETGLSSTVHDTGLPLIDSLPAWADDTEELELDDVLRWVESTGRTVREVEQRLTALGFRVADLRVSPELGPDDLAYLRQVDSYGARLLPETPLSWPQLVYSAARARTTVPEAAERLTRLGYTVAAPLRGDVRPGEGDVSLLEALYRTEDGSGRAGTDALSVAQVAVASLATLASPAAVAARAGELRIEVPGHRFGAMPLDDTDRRILSRDLDGQGPWLDPNRDIPVPHLIGASRATGLDPDAVAERLRLHGFTPPEVAPRWAGITDEDLLMLSARASGLGHYPDADTPMSRDHVRQIALARNVPLADVRRRLADLGYTVPREDPVLDGLTTDDLSLVTRYVTDWDAEGRTSTVVPAAHVRAAALRLGRPPAELAERLTALGCRVETPPESFADPTPADVLAACLAAPSGAAGPTAEDCRSTELSLADLTALALRFGLPFREVALEATRRGLRHEAEDWFPAPAAGLPPRAAVPAHTTS
ncbi:caspase family protein [Streptomyces sp. NPDC003247]|uniref:wHTH domain-containing protein n=1 Tax=Streptomyces sp. NPDC003247 TaxID=3364677 RepID=UPI003698A61B